VAGGKRSETNEIDKRDGGTLGGRRRVIGFLSEHLVKFSRVRNIRERTINKAAMTTTTTTNAVFVQRGVVANCRGACG